MVEWPGKENDRARGEYGLFWVHVKGNCSDDEILFFEGALESSNQELLIFNDGLNGFEDGLNCLDAGLNLSDVDILVDLGLV